MHSRIKIAVMLLLAGCVLTATGSLSAQSAAVDSLKRMPVKAGDRCIVCDKAVGADGMAVQYRGRRVPVANEAMLNAFVADPDGYFSKLQPRGALFQEGTGSQMQLGWVYFGLWVLTALFTAALASSIALRKGLPLWRWFFTGLLLHLAGVAMAWRKPAATTVDLPAHLAKIPLTSRPLACHNCQEENHPTAGICSNCGSTLMPAEASEAARVLGSGPSHSQE